MAIGQDSEKEPALEGLSSEARELAQDLLTTINNFAGKPKPKSEEKITPMDNAVSEVKANLEDIMRSLRDAITAFNQLTARIR